MLTKKALQRKGRSGQALVIIVIAIIGLIGMTGLAVDGGRAFVDRQGAQSSADSAALAAALSKINKATATADDLEKAAKAIVTINGYDSDTVTVLPITTTTGSLTAAFTGCNGTTNSYTDTATTKSTYIQVKIVTQIDTSFAKLVGVNQMGNCVEAVARAKPTTVIPLCDGNAVVGLNPSSSNCAFDSGSSSSAKWILTGGGLFSNGCADSKDSASVTFDVNKCVATVGNATGGLVGKACGGHASPYTAAYIASITPPNPCTGAITGVDPNRRYAAGGKVPISGQTSFSNDVYCITDLDALTKKDIGLTHATLYVIDTEFDLKFAGSGGFFGTATVTGAYTGSENYAGYYMVIVDNGNPCTTFTGNGSNKQVIEFRGNGAADVTGTIFAPSACIDYRGNSNAKKTESQVIGYTVTSNGNASVEINYDQTKNGQQTIQSRIELIK